MDWIQRMKAERNRAWLLHFGHEQPGGRLSCLLRRGRLVMNLICRRADQALWSYTDCPSSCILQEVELGFKSKFAQTVSQYNSRRLVTLPKPENYNLADAAIIPAFRAKIAEATYVTFSSSPALSWKNAMSSPPTPVGIRFLTWSLAGKLTLIDRLAGAPRWAPLGTGLS